MGCFNLFCFISGKTLQKNEAAVVLPLKAVTTEYRKIKTTRYEAAGLPIVGPYDEYGFVELTSLKHLPIQIKALNNQITKATEKVDLGTLPNHVWGAIIDNHIPYIMMSYKLYSSMVNLISAKEIKALRAEIARMRKDLLQFEKESESIKGSKDDELFKSVRSLIDSASFVEAPLSLLCRWSEVYLDYKELREYIIQEHDEEIVMFYAFCKVMDELGRQFIPDKGLGRQGNNKNLVMRYNELILETLKGKS